MSNGTAAATPPSKGLHVGLWIVQTLLALLFLTAGVMKATQPLEELVKSLPWVTDLPNVVRIIGVSELLGALGLILPSALRIKPVLTVAAAVGLVAVMILAAGFHVMRSEPQAVPINLVFGALAAFVAWGRAKKAPIAPR